MRYANLQSCSNGLRTYLLLIRYQNWRLRCWSLRMDSNYIPHFIMDVITYLCWDYSRSILEKWAPGPHSIHDDVIKWKNVSASLAHCAGNSPVTGEFALQRPVTRVFDVFFDLYPNKRLSKRSIRWWLEKPSRSSWRHCNVEYWIALVTIDVVT